MSADELTTQEAKESTVIMLPSSPEIFRVQIRSISHDIGGHYD